MAMGWERRSKKKAPFQGCLLSSNLVGTTGFEPATFCSQSRRDTKLRYVPIIGAPDKNRTRNLLVRSQTLYPVELQAHIWLHYYLG